MYVFLCALNDIIFVIYIDGLNFVSMAKKINLQKDINNYIICYGNVKLQALS